MQQHQFSQSRLKELLHYDQATGIFRWITNRKGGPRAGDIAGKSLTNGYLRIGVDGKLYYAHRLAFFYMTGRWPDQIDHFSGDRIDNRWCNLRESDFTMNAQNRRTANPSNRVGLLGVTINKKAFVAQISVGRKTIYLGSFNSAKDAHDAYIKMKRKLHAGSTL